MNPDDDIPASGDWLKRDALFKKFNALPLSQRRTLSVAAVKAGQVYGSVPEKWNTLMFKAQNQYMVQRNKNQKNPVEKKLWPKDGFKSIAKAATEQKRRIRHKLKEEPSISNLGEYQMYIVLRLFSKIPFRNGFADMQVSKKSDGNYIEVPKKGLIVFHMREYKNSKQLGERSIKLDRGNTIQLKKFLKYRGELGLKHNYLLSTRTGAKMSRATLGKALHKKTKALLGKAFGSRMIRILAASDSKDVIMAASDLSNKMLHTMKQTKQYIRK